MTAEGASPTHQRVGWFELFYDLVIVAAVGYTAHTFAHHPTWALGAWIAAWTLIMFALWLLTALNNNLYPGDRPARRLLGLLQMMALVVAALGTVADEGLSNATGFVALAVAFGTVAAMYAMAVRGGAADQRSVRVLGASSALGALVLLLGIFLPDDAEWTLLGAPPWLLAAGIGMVVVPLFAVAGRIAGSIDREHLVERLGQLVIIVLGESFVSLVSALGGLPAIPNPVFFVMTFAVVFAIWTVYFASVLPAGMPSRAGRLRWWLAGHWLLMFGALGAAGGFSVLTVVPFDVDAPETAAVWTTAPLCFVMAAVTLLTWLGVGAVTWQVRLHAAVAVALLVLAAVGVALTPGGNAWEIVLGGLLVVADAAILALRERPYSRAVAG
jgi:low temperature requirement protein LtrA